MNLHRNVFLPVALAVFGFGLIAPTAAEAQRRLPNYKMEKDAKLRSTKAALMAHGKAGKEAYSELKAALRSEYRLREQTVQAENLRTRADANLRARPGDARYQQAAEAARQNHRDWRARHENSRSVVLGAYEKTNAIRAGNLQELIRVRKAYSDAREVIGKRVDADIATRVSQGVTPQAAREAAIVAESGRQLALQRRQAAQQAREQAREQARRQRPKIVQAAQAQPTPTKAARVAQPSQLLTNPAAFPAAGVPVQVAATTNVGIYAGAPPQQVSVYTRGPVKQDRYQDTAAVRAPSQYDSPTSPLN